MDFLPSTSDSTTVPPVVHMPQFDNHLFKYIETKSFIFFNLMYFCVIFLNAQRFNVFQRFGKKPSQFLVLDFIYFSLFVYFIIILTDLLYLYFQTL